MKKALVIGGSNGIGLAVTFQLSTICSSVTIVDRKRPIAELPNNVLFIEENLITSDFCWLENLKDIDILFYSAGFGRVCHFEDLHPKEIYNSFVVNTISAFKILNFFMPSLKGEKNFYCGIMVSIAGRIASPLFSIYSATKAALYRGIEAINTELEMTKSKNRILEISPGVIKGTSFSGKKTDLKMTQDIVINIIDAMISRKNLLIPNYDNIYRDVINRYLSNPSQFAKESYAYKINNNRLQPKRQLTIGYLSGTFDLFHIGHLNLLKRAKTYCDYLVVGVHRDASHKKKVTFIPFEERVEILKSIRYVDKVIESEKEDVDVYKKEIVKYDKLFVGSDYKGTERFQRYEEYFADKNVEIIYFPYTKGTSSTQLRAAIEK